MEKLTRPIIKGLASISYARQIAHDGAGFFESFPRDYNYPKSSHIRGIEDADTFGVYTIFAPILVLHTKTQRLKRLGALSMFY